MTDNMIELAKRAVACKGWRWMPGMRTGHNPEYGVSGVPQTWVIYVSDGGLIDVGQHYQRRGQFPAALGQCVPGGGLATRLPDLTDPATLGCLLALVRKARGEPTYLPTCLDAHDEAWVIEYPAQKRQTRYGSYASVIVAALEAAP